MVTAIAVYLGILAVFLVHVATHGESLLLSTCNCKFKFSCIYFSGPELEAKLLSKIMSPSEW